MKPVNDNEEVVVFESCGNIFKDLDIPDWELETKRAEKRIRERKKHGKTTRPAKT